MAGPQLYTKWSAGFTSGPRSAHATNGLPEGCGLSVVGMLLINVITDKWLQVRAPLCSLWTYVDNLEITVSYEEDVQSGYYLTNLEHRQVKDHFLADKSHR